MKDYKFTFTQEEVDAALIQIGARIDSLKDSQLKEGKNGNIKRVLEIEKFMQPIISFKEKLMIERYK
jgi:hypothetical protein